MATRTWEKSSLWKACPPIDLRPVSEYDVTITEVWNYVIEAVNSDSSMDTPKAMELFETEIRKQAAQLDQDI